MVEKSRLAGRARWNAVAPVLCAGMMTMAAPLVALGANGWQYEVTPYLWAAGLDGETQVGNLPSVGINGDFTDVLDFVDIGLMGAFEARKGDIGFLADALFIKLSEDMDTHGPFFGSARTEITQQMYSVAVAKRVIKGANPIDALAGIRYNSVKVDLALTDGILAGQRDDATKDWLDGFIGIRAQHALSPHWTLTGYLDVGTGGSDMTWQALAGANYAFSKTISGKFGYRYLSVNVDNDDLSFDMAMKGVYGGVGIRF